MDADDLIPKIDELFGELWLGIDAEVAPYFRKMKEIVENSDDTLAMADLLPSPSQASVATDRGFVMLQLYRMTLKLKKEAGQVKKVPDFEQLPVTGLLKKTSRLSVIFGSAGTGKSTSLKRLAYVLATRGLKFDSTKPTIPILLRATDIGTNIEFSLVEHCAAEVTRITGASKNVFSADDLSNGRVLVLVDALDELPKEGDRIAVLSMIQQFHSDYPSCGVIITSRDYDTVKNLSALEAFDSYSLSPIDYKQAAQIIRTVQKGRNLPAEKSHELVRRLEAVHGMELNPLLVTVFAATTEYSRQDIPANITELFKKFTEIMLGRWDASKGFKEQYHAPLKDSILQKVAFEMHRDGLTRIEVARFEQIVTTELENRGFETDVAQLIEQVIVRSGLFIVLGTSIEFRHLMMQEFFAGRGIPNKEYLNQVIDNPWWRRAVVFYFGEHPDDSSSLRAAISALDTRSREEQYNAALTLGLALQACYLIELKNKIDIYRWVVDGISNAKDEFLMADLEGEKFPVRRFLFYYLFGRDSVALSVLETRIQEITAQWETSGLSQDERDIRTFWIICGLIECGAMSEVERLTEKFKPADPRLLFGIHLGCYLTQQVRVATKEQCKIAERVCDLLSDPISHLRTKLLEEVRSELLELREGTIQTVEARSQLDESEKKDE